MGTVISFPTIARTERGPKAAADKLESAMVIILPVIRIERHGPADDFEPEASSSPRRRRRRRATRP